MSLSNVLNSVHRAKIPNNILSKIKSADQVVVENIAHLAQEQIPSLDITLSSLNIEANTYHLIVPLISGSVFLSDLKLIQSYSPSRLKEIKISNDNNQIAIQFFILDETSPLMVSDVDIIRVCKRQRTFR